jgi:membrane-bound serine protease (ClpP class)
VALAAGGVLTVLAPGAGAAGEGRRGIEVVQVDGLLDAPNVTLVADAIERANRDRLTMVLLQIDSRGAITGVDNVVRAIDRSRVPVVVWVGPSGGEATGGAALVAEAAHVVFVSNGSRIGSAHPVRLDEPDSSSAQVADRLASLAESRGRDPEAARVLARRSLSSRDAARRGATDGVRPTVGEAIVTLDGATVPTAAGDVELSTAKVVGEGRDRRRQANQEVVFDNLGLGGQLQHALIGPSTAYFLFVAGLGLIVFEFFAASVGIAGVAGAVAVVGAMYGFSHLPVHWWAVALLVLAALGFAVDAQAGALGFWTGFGAVALVAGSVTLFGGDSDLRPAWWLVGLVCAVVAFYYVFAVPPFLRSRYSTPTIGREGMIGERGTAEVAVDPDGVVSVRGARWRAHTHRVTPIEPGDSVRVVAVRGLVLEVEPEGEA